MVAKGTKIILFLIAAIGCLDLDVSLRVDRVIPLVLSSDT